jgi:ribosomal protein S12 methylthiotransferase accessory factor
MIYKFLPISDLPKFRELFPALLYSRFARLYVRILTRLASVLGQALYWRLPQHYESLADNFEVQRAIRITNRLLQTGYLQSSYLSQEQVPDEPFSYVSVVDFPHDTNVIGWRGKYVHLFDSSQTYWPALGEAVERMCLLHPHYKSREVVSSSYRKLKKPKVDIFDLAGFTSQQRSGAGAKYNLTYDADSVFEWVPCTDMTNSTTLYAPLQWFSFSHVMEKLVCRTPEDSVEPMLTVPITTGAAAGQNLHDAILAGLLEVIERDAFIIYWLNQMQAQRIDLSTIKNEEIAQLSAIASDYRLEIHALYLQTDIPVHTISVVILDRTGAGPAVMVSAKSGYDINAILISLLHDSLGQRSQVRKTYDDIFTAQTAAEPNIIDHAGRMIYWYHQKQIEKIEYFIGGDTVAVSDFPTYVEANSTQTDLMQLIQWFRENDYQVLYRELISPKLKKITEDLSVVMVKVPKLQPVYLEEWLRSTHGTRLQEIPVQFGYPKPGDGDDPYHQEPHPFP